jgi:hypothetical protein
MSSANTSNVTPTFKSKPARAAAVPARQAPDAPSALDKNRMLPPARLADPDFGWRTFEATVPDDTLPEQIVSGGFWRLCAPRLSRGDHVRWRNDALTRFGEIVFVAADAATGTLEARELWHEAIDPAANAETERGGFVPKDFGVFEGWGIVRVADGQIVARNLRSRDEAFRRIQTEWIARPG